MFANKKIGMLGGGQLGRMSIEAANNLNIDIIILDKQPNPAIKVSSGTTEHINANFQDFDQIQLLASKCDVLTVEIEHVNVDALDKVVKTGAQVHPHPSTLRIIQDKYLQKQEFARHNLPLSQFCLIDGSLASALAAGERFGYPFLLKSRKLAYDGRGNFLVKTATDLPTGLAALGGASITADKLYVEKFVPFIKELAVMVVRSVDGSVQSYPVVETIQSDNICKMVIAPAQIDGQVAVKAAHVAEQAVAIFKGAGVFGVEMFLVADGSILLNEIAPRPHNSGHYTIEACYTSQFENHVRAVAGLPLGCADMKVAASIMINILGTGDGSSGIAETLQGCVESLSLPGTTVHLYGKPECRLGRKMGHITIVGDTMSKVWHTADLILKASNDRNDYTNSRKLSPVVGIIMGSDSDLGVMKPAAMILRQFGVPFEISVVSAHRTPARMIEYAENAHKRGIKVVIAAAGGAAHLPGMVAAITPLPVIGVPVALKFLDGQDSLYSIVQMPRGVPVATVAINNSTNAALLAIRILGSHTPSYLDRLIEYRLKQEEIVMEKVDKLALTGWEKYEA